VALPRIGQGCCYQIAAGDAGFLTMGGLPREFSPRFAMSDDGVDWRILKAVDWQGVSVGQISGWSGRYIAAGVRGPDEERHAAFWASTDGLTWEELPDSPALRVGDVPTGPKASKVQISMLDAVGHEITAVAEIWPEPCHEGCDGPIAVIRWTSSDGGQSWTRHELAAELENRYPPIRIGDLWVRIAPYWAPLQSSRDRTTWQTAWDRPEGDYYELSRVRLTSFGGVLVGSLNDEGLIVSSTDGESWIESTGWPDLEDAANITDVAGNATTLVAVGYSYRAGTPIAYAFVSPPLP
jgi:hypothetical protein